MNAVEIKVTGELTKFIDETAYEDLSEEVIHIAKRCMIDGIGVMLAGSMESCTRIVREYVLSVEGKKESSIVGEGRMKAPAHLAALVNGTAGHALDWDDSAMSTAPDRSVLLHPTMQPLAAGLAVGEMLNASGRNLLTAFVTGFEISCKIAEGIDPQHWQSRFPNQKPERTD